MSAAVVGAGLALGGVADVVRALYGVAVGANKFLDKHIALLKASDQPALATTGRVLEGAKAGFGVGYGGCLAVVAVGQLILGNPLTAGAAVLSAAVGMNPIAVSCGAIGAIFYGWRALSEAERDAIVMRVVEVLDLAHDTVRALVQFVLHSARKISESPLLSDLKQYLKAEAESCGRLLSDVTRNAADRARDLLGRRPDPFLISAGNDELHPVVQAMKTEELRAVLAYPFDKKVPADADDGQMQEMLVEQITAAGSSSLPLTRRAEYGEVLVMVARHLDIPVPVRADAGIVEHYVLFKVLERSIEKMGEEEKNKFLAVVQEDLNKRGVGGTVSLEQVTRFVKVAGMDIGGAAGTLAITAPGLAGLAGLNVLQLVVLKGLVATSGYFAATTSLLGIGAGGALMTVAGVAGPISAGLGVLYGIYRLSGPAYRKMIPAVCAIAAKRIEMSAQRPEPPRKIVVQDKNGKGHESQKTCSICGQSYPLGEFTYGKRENRSYCQECSRRERQAYSRGGASEARAFRDEMRRAWRT
ncbi:MAG: hypothetical protein ACO1PB_07115 [Ramlibacter sp.]